MKNIHSERNLKSFILGWIVVPVIGGILIAFFFCMDCFRDGNYSNFLEEAAISAILWSVLGNGNGQIIPFLDKHWSWLEHTSMRLLISIAFVIIYSTLATTLVLYLYINWVKGGDFVDIIGNQGVVAILALPLGLTIFISVILHGAGFLSAWRKEAVNVEKLKNENLTAKFESLKNQINPHFLFNSLNALTSLVYADQDRAVEFIHKLSDVYRYVLDHQYDEVVTLETEMELVRSFVFLNKIRFGHNLEVEYQIGENLKDWQLPPLTLQMLLENCFKHNEISKERKLTVQIIKTGAALTISNNINPINHDKNESKGVGLNNIIARYEYLSSHQVVVNQTKTQFEVTVPLLKINQA